MNTRRWLTLLLILALLIPSGLPADVRAVGETAPGAPIGVTAIMGDGEATVTWVPPAIDGGSPITGYTVTAVEDPSKTATVGSVLFAKVTGLTNGVACSFRVKATNAVGTGPESAASNSVTPAVATVISTAVTWSGLQTFGNLTIASGGSVTHNPGDATLQIQVAGTLRIETGGSVDLSGKGCGADAAWSMATSTCAGSAAPERAGGSYGGVGGSGGVAAYGDLTNPAELGSGGRAFPYNGRVGNSGGGLVRLTAGNLILNGAIRANGFNASGGGGSGGGVRISTTLFSGAGSVEAKGGNGGGDGGGGGGGRIAVLADTSTFSGSLTATPGSGGFGAGGGGTAFTSTRAGANPNLVVDGGGLAGTLPTTPAPIPPGGTTLAVQGRAVVQASGSNQLRHLTLVGGSTLTLGGPQNFQNAVVVDGSTGILSGVQQFQELTVTNGGSVTHPAGDATLRIEVTGTLRIDTGSNIDVSGKGCGADAAWSMATSTCAGSAAPERAGGSYGGVGGSGGVAAYGDLTSPAELGSGGRAWPYNGRSGGSSGGLVRLTAGSLILNGTIRANGFNANGGAGSGGGVRISTTLFSGAGSMEAKGGSSTSGDTGSGGGGRIAVLADTSTFTGSLTATPGGGGGPGGAGTVFSSTRAGANPSLVVDGGGLTGLPTTPLSIPPGGTTLAVQGRAVVQASGSNQLRHLTLVGGSTLTLGGPQNFQNAVVVDGSTAILSGVQQFQELTVTNGGSVTHPAGDATLRIEVTGTLRIDAGSSIDVSGKGCDRNAVWSTATSACTGSPTGVGAGGSYGGVGGGGGVAAYGDLTNPVELGSGGRDNLSYFSTTGRSGGGLVRLTAGSLILSGTIRANSSDASAGAGSGGGVRIDTRLFSGAGSIEAKGGSSTGGGGGSGGGGRIAVYRVQSSFTGSLAANGGTGGYGAGGAGTVYTWLAPVPSDVRVANVSESAFDVSWVSDRDASARVRYGITDTFGVRQVVGTVPDLRGAGYVARTHYMRVGGVDPSTGAADPYWNLDPGTTYWFEILADGPEPVISTGSATTGATLALRAADVRFGFVARPNGSRVAGALVYLAMQDADGADSTGSAGLLSAVTDADGAWSIDLSRGRTGSLAASYVYGAGDRLHYTAGTPTSRPGSKRVTVGTVSPLTITVPGADLAPTSASFDPSPPSAFLTATWSVVVSNLGFEDWLGGDGGSSFAVRSAVDGQVQTTVSSTLMVGVGLSVTITGTLVFSPGQHTVVFEVVPSGEQVAEDGPANNVLTQTLTVSPADLAVTSATSALALPIAGRPVTFSVVISNVGTVDWLGPGAASFFDVVASVDGQVQRTARSDAIVNRGMSLTLSIPMTLTPGVRTLRFELVPGGSQVGGEDAANNVLTRTVMVYEAFGYRFGPGWNAVTLALTPTVGLRVSDLAAAMNGDGTTRLQEVFRYRNGLWDGTTIVTTTVWMSDFVLAVGEGYFFRFGGRTTWELVGSALATPVSQTLSVGWNLVGIPTATSLSAAGVVMGTDVVTNSQVVHRLAEVDRWFSGGYEAYVAGYAFNNFAIQRHWGYFLKANESFGWMP